MEINTKYICKADVAEREFGYQLTDYKGETLLTMSSADLKNGDLVALVQECGSTKLMRLDSRFQIDSLLKKRFVAEMNQLMQAKGKPARIKDYGYWFIDIDGTEKLNNRTIH